MTAVARADLAGERLASLALPALDELNEQQVRGTACVWNARHPLTNGTAVDLGPRQAARAGQPLTWFPRACRKCTHDHVYSVLLDHAPSCEQCVDNAAECPTGRALLRLMREYRR